LFLSTGRESIPARVQRPDPAPDAARPPAEAAGRSVDPGGGAV